MSFMIGILLKIVLVMANAFGDRLRGGLWHKPLGISNTLYGSVIFTGCLVLLLGLSPLEGSVVLLASLLGSAPGWGEPLGSYILDRPQVEERLEWWQVGPLKTNITLSLLVRGFIWGLPIALVLSSFEYYLAGGTVLLAYTVSMLAAPWFISRKYYYRSAWDATTKWQMQEWLRGGLVMLALVTFV